MMIGSSEEEILLARWTHYSTAWPNTSAKKDRWSRPI